MTVNFDNLRVRAANSYISLCNTLNELIRLAKEDGYETTHVPLDPDLIQEEMDDLRMQIIVICSCYDEKAGLKSVGDDLQFPVFNKIEP